MSGVGSVFSVGGRFCLAQQVLGIVGRNGGLRRCESTM